MAFKKVADFEVDFFQILDENGNCNEKDLPQELAEKDFKEMYRLMVLSRAFDDKAVKLQRQGRLGTYPPLLGQEASQIGSAFAMFEDDWFFPSFREQGVFICRGMKLDKAFQFWNWDERGSFIPTELNAFPICIPVATQLTQAVGFSLAAKLQKQNFATLVFFGDGATSEGDFHEALNFAGEFSTPTVFICENNSWAISLAREKQTASKTLAQKAISYGFEGEQVDGNDVFAVYSVVRDAVKKARDGKGPTFIECVTYRMGMHTTSDDPTKYRSQSEVDFWKKKDPIERLKKFLMKKGILTEQMDKEIFENSSKQVEEAVSKYFSYPEENIDECFNHLYEKMPKNLEEQLDELKQNMK